MSNYRSAVQRIWTPWFIALLFVSGCAVDQESTTVAESDPADVQAAIEGIWQEYARTYNSNDLESWLSLWTDDGLQMPPDEPPVAGKEQIRARNRAVLELFAVDLDITNEEVEAAGDVAYARGVYEATLTPEGEGEPVQLDGKYMTVFRRQSDGSWKIHRDIFNSNVPAAE